jgi:ubiquinone/menaquinone biosynthesis C-methylase UbiE
MMYRVPYDPTLYQGAAEYYARGRPPYSASLESTLETELGLDGSGRVLDVGCGPGVLAIRLAGSFHEAVGLDPDADMLTEAARRAHNAGVENIRWVQAVAEDIPELDLGTFRLVTFGQSFQWTERERVAEAVYDILEPGGALALITHAHEGRPQPEDPGLPEIPHDEIHALVRRYLGPRRRAGQGFRSEPPDRYEDALARTRFGESRSLFAAGRPDIVRDVDSVVAGFFSMSFATPQLFGEERDAFEADLRAVLGARSPSGLFWDWPGDTEILLARKPERSERK